MKKFLFPLMTIIFLIACNNNKQTAAYQTVNDSSADVAAIIKLDSEWSKASESKSAEKWLSYYSDDAIMMPPNEKVCSDKASREASVKNMFATPGISLAFQTTKAEVSHSGDLGYAVGAYQLTSKDAKGNDYHETGKYCETWKKQSDGSWKCVADIWNADPIVTK